MKAPVVRKGDRVRLRGNLDKAGKVRQLAHENTQAHVKWDFIDEGIVAHRRTIENVADLEVIKKKRTR